MLVFLVLSLGCSDDMMGPDEPAGDWQRLIASQWTVAPGLETYQCERLTASEDMYIVGFRSVAPLGTHHSVLTVGDPNQPDGPSACNAATNAEAMIYSSGIGTNDALFPPGVAMPVKKGQQLLLNLHLYNASDNMLDDTSAVEIKTIPASMVKDEAEVVLMGKISLLVPPGESTQVGHCVMNGDVTVFTVAPHMHRLGTRASVVAKRSGMPDTVLHDGPYEFTEQGVFLVDPVTLKRGDTIEVGCTYNNTTGADVFFGESSDEEMCFASVYRSPAFGGTISIICAV